MRRLLVCVLIGALIGRAAASFATTIHVASGGDLQAAINSAVLGDTITLEAGATWTGHYTLPDKGSGTNYITIESDTNIAANLPPGIRVTPASAAYMPIIAAPGANAHALDTAAHAHHYKIIGVEFTIPTALTSVSELIVLGDNTLTDVSQQAHDFIFDRCYVHGHPTNNIARRGFSLQCGTCEIRNCWIDEFHTDSEDTQCIGGWNGTGPYIIDNCELQAASENVAFGGGDIAIANNIPGPITITRNHFYKPLSWRVGDPTYAGFHWNVKNLLEFKTAQDVLVDHNIFENCWADGQSGYCFNIKSVNQNGINPWDTTQRVTITNNIIRHCAAVGGIGVDPLPVVRPNNIVFRNNLCYDISTPNWGGDGYLWVVSDVSHFTVDHNTFIQTGSLMLEPGAGGGYGMDNLTWTNNISPHSLYGVKGGGLNSGLNTLDTWWPGTYTFTGNAIWGIVGTGVATSAYPTGNLFPNAPSDIGFIDFAGGNYALAANSPYKHAATDGTDIGWNNPGAHFRGDVSGGSSHVRGDISGSSTHMRGDL